MIEIKQSRKLHESGYRLMEVTYSDKDKPAEVINDEADVIHLGFGHMFSDIRIDITKKGVIRIFSDVFDIKPDKMWRGSDSVFRVTPKNKEIEDFIVENWRGER
jgi:hypothetical protein